MKPDLPIKVQFKVYGRNAAVVEEEAVKRLKAFAGGRRQWYIDTLDAQPLVETSTCVASWEAEVVGRVGK